MTGSRSPLSTESFADPLSLAMPVYTPWQRFRLQGDREQGSVNPVRRVQGGHGSCRPLQVFLCAVRLSVAAGQVQAEDRENDRMLGARAGEMARTGPQVRCWETTGNDGAQQSPVQSCTH